MLIVTIIIPDTGSAEATEAAERLIELAEALGGQVLQAHAVDVDGGDLDAVDAAPRR